MNNLHTVLLNGKNEVDFRFFSNFLLSSCVIQCFDTWQLNFAKGDTAYYTIQVQTETRILGIKNYDRLEREGSLI